MRYNYLPIKVSVCSVRHWLHVPLKDLMPLKRSIELTTIAVIRHYFKHPYQGNRTELFRDIRSGGIDFEFKCGTGYLNVIFDTLPIDTQLNRIKTLYSSSNTWSKSYFPRQLREFIRYSTYRYRPQAFELLQRHPELVRKLERVYFPPELDRGMIKYMKDMPDDDYCIAFTHDESRPYFIGLKKDIKNYLHDLKTLYMEHKYGRC
jgi:hypothetical protein